MTEPMAILFLAGFSLISIAAVCMMASARAGILYSVTTVLGILIMLTGLETLRGEPKLMSNEIQRPEVARVLWSGSDKEGILLLLTWEGLKTPRYYRMTSTPETEHKMKQARREAEVKRTYLLLRNPFGGKSTGGQGEPSGGGTAGGIPSGGNGNGTNEGGPNFYPAPPPPQEEKPTIGLP